MKTDIEIAQSSTMQHIRDIAKVANVEEKYLEQYGNYKAKVDYNLLKEHTGPDGKLILVTAITPHPGRRGKNHHHRGPGRRAAEASARTIRRGPAGAVSRPRVRRQGRRGRRRLRPGRAHGGHQPPLHRRLPRHRRGQQPAGRHAGQPHPAGQRPGHRREEDHLEALCGHERPPAAQHRGRPGRPDAGRAP